MEGSKCHCGEDYNQMDRQLILLPCGDKICLVCFDKLLQPQENKLICPYDQEEVQITQKFKNAILQMKQKSSAMWIICKVHNQQADYYCQQDKKLICLKCILTHQDHFNQITELKKGVVDSYLEMALGMLASFQKRTEKACEQIQTYQAKAKSYSTNEFLDIIKEIQDILLLISNNQNNLELLKGLPPKTEHHLQPQVVVQPIMNNNILAFDKYTLDTFKITDNDQKLLQQWLGGNAKLQLLYRGTRDGDKATKFHQLCDNKGPTLSIVKSQMDYVFGGYTSISWLSDNKWKEDKDAFLYSLHHKTQHKVIQERAEDAIGHYANYLSVYGSAGNFTLMDNFINSTTSHTMSFGTTYQLPEGMQSITDQSRSYMSGTKDNQFRVKEAEIYLVIR